MATGVGTVVVSPPAQTVEVSGGGDVMLSTTQEATVSEEGSEASRTPVTKSLTAAGTWTAVPSPGAEGSGGAGARVGVGVLGWGLGVWWVGFCGVGVL